LTLLYPHQPNGLSADNAGASAVLRHDSQLAIRIAVTGGLVIKQVRSRREEFAQRIEFVANATCSSIKLLPLIKAPFTVGHCTWTMGRLDIKPVAPIQDDVYEEPSHA